LVYLFGCFFPASALLRFFRLDFAVALFEFVVWVCLISFVFFAGVGGKDVASLFD